MKSKTGILVAQLGSPDNPTPSAVRRYLREFLGDRRVVDLHPLLWWFVLNGIILARRPAQSAALYRKVWTDEGSPLLTISNAQARGLQTKLNGSLNEDSFRVEVAMRYGNPSTSNAVEKLCEWGAERILLFPMYPQYSATTTASTYDEVFRVVANRRLVPTLRVVPPYFDHPGYIKALAESIRERLGDFDQQPERILLSFHGIPERYATLGDPYPIHCRKTGEALADEMGWGQDDYLLTFQSRFGKEPWLQPYTDVTFAKLGEAGVKRLLVVCPGFVSDCLETIDEMGNLGLEQFRAAGGERLDLVSCLNARPRWIEAMEQIALEQLRGWI